MCPKAIVQKYFPLNQKNMRKEWRKRRKLNDIDYFIEEMLGMGCNWLLENVLFYVLFGKQH